MNYLRGFVPWIAFAVASSAGRQWGALANLADPADQHTSIPRLTNRSRRTDRPVDHVVG